MRVLSFLIILSIFGCSGIKISGVDAAEGFTISKYKTYNFFEIGASGDAIGPNYRKNVELLKTAITKQIQAKGLTIDRAEPDLLINIGIAVTEEVQTRETNFANPADRQYMGTRNYSWESKEVPVNRYRQGSITIDLVDRVANAMVWQGTAESVIPSKEKNVPALIESSMEKLFEEIK